jgi:hypothetical protein
MYKGYNFVFLEGVHTLPLQYHIFSSNGPVTKPTTSATQIRFALMFEAESKKGME